MANEHYAFTFIIGCLCIVLGYGRELYYTHRNYTTKFPRTTYITANLSLSTNPTMDELPRTTTVTANLSLPTNPTIDLNDKPAMEDVLENKHAFSNDSITNTTKTNSDITAIVVTVTSVAVVTAVIVIIVVVCVRKSRRGIAADANAPDQNIGLMKHNP